MVGFGGHQDGIATRRIQQRAAYWYRRALPGLSGLTKDKVEKRLKEADALGQHRLTADTEPLPDAELPRSKWIDV